MISIISTDESVVSTLVQAVYSGLSAELASNELQRESISVLDTSPGAPRSRRKPPRTTMVMVMVVGTSLKAGFSNYPDRRRDPDRRARRPAPATRVLTSTDDDCDCDGGGGGGGGDDEHEHDMIMMVMVRMMISQPPLQQ